jgi:2-keto-3-deoxy-6-phosphogluconate aldolase
MSLNWKAEICALGGISDENIRKIKITKIRTVGIKSWIYKK